MGDYTKLAVWQKAHLVAIDCHRLARDIRGNEYSSMRSQIIRAAFSVPANLVEGNGMQSAKEYNRFVHIALNSSNELDYHILAATELGLIPKVKADQLRVQIEEVRKMLHGLHKYLAGRINAPRNS